MDENKVTNSVFELANIMRKVATKTLQMEFDISFTTHQALAVLDDRGEMTQHRLASYLMISDPAVSRLVTNLESEGLIAIRINPHQKRQRLVSISASGQEIYNNCRNRLETMFAHTLNNAKVDLKEYEANTRSIINSLHRMEDENE